MNKFKIELKDGTIHNNVSFGTVQNDPMFLWIEFKSLEVIHCNISEVVSIVTTNDVYNRPQETPQSIKLVNALVMASMFFYVFLTIMITATFFLVWK